MTTIKFDSPPSSASASSIMAPVEVSKFHHTPNYCLQHCWKSKKEQRCCYVTREPSCLNDCLLYIFESGITMSERKDPHLCEENVYLLCKKLCSDGLADSDGSDLFVIFISNEKKQIPLWHQKASQRADGIVLWDYHVICIQKQRDVNSVLVWDLDSSLPFPSPLASYVAESIRPSFKLFSEFERFFRIVHAPIFLQCFASDRRHMKDSAGNWISEPPSYQPIVAEDGAVHNLNKYMEISSAEVLKNVEATSIDAVFSKNFGVVVGESQLEEFFS